MCVYTVMLATRVCAGLALRLCRSRAWHAGSARDALVQSLTYRCAPRCRFACACTILCMCSYIDTRVLDGTLMIRGRPDAWNLAVMLYSKKWGSNDRHSIQLCINSLVMAQDPAQTKQWGIRAIVLLANCLNRVEITKYI